MNVVYPTISTCTYTLLNVRRNGDDWYRMINAVRQTMLRPSNVHQFAGIANAVTDKLVAVMEQARDRNGHISQLRTLLGRWSQEG